MKQWGFSGIQWIDKSGGDINPRLILIFSVLDGGFSQVFLEGSYHLPQMDLGEKHDEDHFFMSTFF